MEGQRNIAAVWPRGALLKCHKVQHQLNHTSSERKWGGILCGFNNKNAATVFPFHTCSKVHQSNSFSWLFPHSFHESFANHGPGPPIVWLTCIFFLSLVFFFLKLPSRSLHLSPPSCRVCIWASSWCLPLLVRPRWQNFLWAVKDIWNVLWIENQWLLFLCCWEALVLQHLNWFHLFENPWGTIHHNITEGQAKHQCRCRR